MKPGIAIESDVLISRLLSEAEQEDGSISPETMKTVLGMALQTLMRQGKAQEPMYQSLINNIMYLEHHGNLSVADKSTGWEQQDRSHPGYPRINRAE